MPKRLRQHTNPLAFRQAVARPDWDSIFPRKAPLCLDIGFGRGRFLFDLAVRHPERNFVGLEVRKAWVEQARARIEIEERHNISVLHCSANTSLATLFNPGQLTEVYLNFPDPWPKRAHHKRRVVTPELVRTLGEQVHWGGLVFVQTDWAELAQEMCLRLETGGFINLFGPRQSAPGRILLVWTHREQSHRRRGHPIYRYVFRRPASAEAAIFSLPATPAQQ